MTAHAPALAALALAFPVLGTQDGGGVTPPAPRTPAIDVRVDPRVELLSVIFRLAGNPEYGQGKVDAYTRAVDAHFGEFADHAVVRRARLLRRERGVSYDACMSLAVHLTDARALRERVPFSEAPEGLDGRWTEEGARAFLKDARRFVVDTEFAVFFDSQRALYDVAVERMQGILVEGAGLDWFDRFFGARPSARFELVLGMLNGGANYGPRVVHPDGREDLYCVLGVWSIDADGLPRFDPSMLGTVVHEFCHSYCNRLIDAHTRELEVAGEELWPHVAEVMRAQAYGNWQTMLRESLVRAAVVRYMAAVRGDAARRTQVDEEEGRGFRWTGALSDVLAEYEQRRDEHPTLDSFMPRVVEFFDGYADELEALEARRPKVTRMVPANGAEDVDPDLAAIVITFDRPMRDRAWSFVGGGPHFPKTTGQPSYDETRTVLTLPVELKPDWSYELWLNRGRFDSFQSEDGAKLAPVRVRFKTRP